MVHLVRERHVFGCSSVRERGEDAICVGAEERGGRGMRDVIGISVEWGILEGLQLALLPRYSNSQTEHQHTENGHAEMLCLQSEVPFLASSGKMVQGNSQMFETVESRLSQCESRVSLCPSEPAVGFKVSNSQMQGKGGTIHMTQSERKKVGGEGGVAYSPPSDSVTARNAPAYPDFQFSFLPLDGHPLSSTHLFPHESGTYEWEEEAETEGRRRVEKRHGADEMETTVGVFHPTGFKRQRSEGVPTESNRPVGCEGGGWVWGKKQRLVAGSLLNSALFPFDSCGKVWPQIAGGGVAAGENARRAGKGGEVKVAGPVHIFCEYGRTGFDCQARDGKEVCAHGCRRRDCKECGGKDICEHGRRRRNCKECGGKGICEHGRRRRDCKECEETGICEHGGQRSTGKECRVGGKDVYEYQWERNACLPNSGGAKDTCENLVGFLCPADCLGEQVGQGGDDVHIVPQKTEEAMLLSESRVSDGVQVSLLPRHMDSQTNLDPQGQNENPRTNLAVFEEQSGKPISSEVFSGPSQEEITQGFVETKKRSSGCEGVYLASAPYPAWVAQWYTNGKRCKKYFSVRKYGDAAALEEAIAWRKKNEQNPVPTWR
uniref:AP2/ERF domain-containing protein n=1 Tax=Chromera velia CCMP2878 TaxID=1169474 RepID=A0A0G4FHD1_9ALVE|eukprot:Cvel_16855.t1-p1 / transcript=Cvel_16855.t1 / gene=Cvel_16855 / organism=Chromera_velia_CCMP2878 / gene_product=hypothetical protein / transcript_product=hypothetical protein / location=Cvel_scaffold1318:9128-11331(+) / protein_length=602 / sequence_SO=supercontig / SO=protein_coding / is_pseudo=false